MTPFPSFQNTSADNPYSGAPTAMKYATGPWWNTTFEALDTFKPSTGSGMMSWTNQNQGAQAVNQNVQALNAATNQVAQGGAVSSIGTAEAPTDTTPNWAAIEGAIGESRLNNPYGTSWYPQQLSSTLENLKSWYGGLDPTKQTAAGSLLLSTAQSLAPAALYGTPETYLNTLQGRVGSAVRTPEEVAADNARRAAMIAENRRRWESEQAERQASERSRIEQERQNYLQTGRGVPLEAPEGSRTATPGDVVKLEPGDEKGRMVRQSAIQMLSQSPLAGVFDRLGITDENTARNLANSTLGDSAVSAEEAQRISQAISPFIGNQGGNAQMPAEYKAKIADMLSTSEGRSELVELGQLAQAHPDLIPGNPNTYLHPLVNTDTGRYVNMDDWSNVNRFALLLKSDDPLGDVKRNMALSDVVDEVVGMYGWNGLNAKVADPRTIEAQKAYIYSKAGGTGAKANSDQYGSWFDYFDSRPVNAWIAEEAKKRMNDISIT